MSKNLMSGSAANTLRIPTVGETESNRDFKPSLLQSYRAGRYSYRDISIIDAKLPFRPERCLVITATAPRYHSA